MQGGETRNLSPRTKNYTRYGQSNAGNRDESELVLMFKMHSYLYLSLVKALHRQMSAQMDIITSTQTCVFQH